jgi:hypothetical protein
MNVWKKYSYYIMAWIYIQISNPKAILSTLDADATYGGVNTIFTRCSTEHLTQISTDSNSFDLFVYTNISHIFVCFLGVINQYGCIFHSPVADFSLLVFRGFLITHNDAPEPVGLLWTSDQSVAEISTWQHTTLTTDKHPCLRWDSNPGSQQASGRRRTP